MLQGHTHISVWIGRIKGPQLCILHDQHRLGAETHSYHGDDVWMVQLAHNGNLLWGKERGGGNEKEWGGGKGKKRGGVRKRKGEKVGERRGEEVTERKGEEVRKGEVSPPPDE